MSTKNEKLLFDIILQLGEDYTSPLGSVIDIPQINIDTFERIHYIIKKMFRSEDFSFKKVFLINDDNMFNADELIITPKFEKFLTLTNKKMFMIQTTNKNRYLTFFRDVNELQFMWHITAGLEDEIIEIDEDEDEDE